jgi:hypothetical protein
MWRIKVESANRGMIAALVLGAPWLKFLNFRGVL